MSFFAFFICVSRIYRRAIKIVFGGYSKKRLGITELSMLNGNWSLLRVIEGKYKLELSFFAWLDVAGRNNIGYMSSEMFP